MPSIAIDRLDGLSSATAMKGPCRVATTANITLEGEQTIDTVAVVEGDRVLVKDQTDARTNGIYTVNTGLWTRTKDFSRNRDIQKGTRVYVTDGTDGWGEYRVTTANPISIGSSNIIFAEMGGSAENIAFTPSGNIAADDVQAAIEELDAEKQPLNSDLTAISGLSTQPYGRSLLTLANATTLAAEVDSFFLTPAEGNAAYQPKSANLDEYAAVNPSPFGLARVADAAAEDARNALDAAPYVATRTALKALDTTKDTVAILTEAGREGAFIWKSGDYSTQITADTAEGIYLKADAVASTAGAWERVFDGPTSPFWFGATGTDTDQTSAINAWVAMSNGWLVLPAGIFKTADPIALDLDSVEAVTVQGAGEAITVLVYTGTASYFLTSIRGDSVDNLADDVGIVIDGVTFRTTQAGTTKAIKAELEDAAPSTGGYEGLVRRISNCRFIGKGSGNYWATAIEWKNSTYSHTQNIFVQGNAAGNTGIEYTGARAGVANFIEGLKQVGGGKMVYITAALAEGLSINDIVGVSVTHGVHWAIPSSLKPLLSITNAHFDLKANGVAILLDGISSPLFNNLCIYCSNDPSTGIELRNTSGTAGAIVPMFSGVAIFATGAATGRKGLVIGAGITWASIGNIYFDSLETGVEIASGAQNITLLNSLGFHNCTNDIVDNTPGTDTDRIRKWSQAVDTQRLAFGSDTGISMELENSAIANVSTKWAQLRAYMRSTLNALVEMGSLRFSPSSGNGVSSSFDIFTRIGGSVASRFNMDTVGDIRITGFLKSSSPTGGIGYQTGAGGAVTQATSRTTGVTLDKVSGAITLVSAAGSATFASFTVTNSAVAATDTIRVVQKSGTDLYEIHVTAVAAGSFRITFRTTGGTTTEQPVFNFAVLKAVAA